MPDTVKIREAIEFLYGRIESPLKKFKVARDEALAELEALEAELGDEKVETEEQPKPKNGVRKLGGKVKLEDKTIDEVLAMIENGEATAAEALEFERQNKQRSTLIEELEARLGEE